MRRKQVKSLKSRCLETIGPYVTNSIRQTVNRADAVVWYSMLQGDTIHLDPESVIKQQVQKLKHHIWSHVIWYDYNAMFKILLRSIDDAVQITRKSWKPSWDVNLYNQEIEHVTAFIYIAINYEMRHLDFADIPNTVRSMVIERLPNYSKLQSLILRAYHKSTGN